MFVYQNAERDICVTFESNKPVANPEYVIRIDHAKGTISVNGQVMAAREDAPAEGVTDNVTEPEQEPTDPVEDGEEESVTDPDTTVGGDEGDETDTGDDETETE